jgi:hypothetical protein
MWLGSQPITVEVIDEDRTGVLLSHSRFLLVPAGWRTVPAQPFAPTRYRHSPSNKSAPLRPEHRVGRPS